jgi:hypothetical protein
MGSVPLRLQFGLPRASLRFQRACARKNRSFVRCPRRFANPWSAQSRGFHFIQATFDLLKPLGQFSKVNPVMMLLRYFLPHRTFVARGPWSGYQIDIGATRLDEPSLMFLPRRGAGNTTKNADDLTITGVPVSTTQASLLRSDAYFQFFKLRLRHLELEPLLAVLFDDASLDRAWPGEVAAQQTLGQRVFEMVLDRPA